MPVWAVASRYRLQRLQHPQPSSIHLASNRSIVQLHPRRILKSKISLWTARTVWIEGCFSPRGRYSQQHVISSQPDDLLPTAAYRGPLALYFEQSGNRLVAETIVGYNGFSPALVASCLYLSIWFHPSIKGGILAS